MLFGSAEIDYEFLNTIIFFLLVNFIKSSSKYNYLMLGKLTTYFNVFS